MDGSTRTAPRWAETTRTPFPRTLRKRRCECAQCGAHSSALAGLATTGGLCPVCGGGELLPVLEPRDRGRSRA